MNEPEDEDDGDGSEESGVVTRVLAVLTAAAGLSALVAFTGAAIVWVRFEEAKLPAEQAVAVTPEPALVTVGGVALGAFALIAGLAVLIVYLVDSQGTPRKQAATRLPPGRRPVRPRASGGQHGRRRGLGSQRRRRVRCGARMPAPAPHRLMGRVRRVLGQSHL